MANENNQIPAGFPKSIDAGKTYRVQLSKAVPYAGTKLAPGKAHSMQGAVLTEFLAGEHKDSFYGAQEA